MSTESIASPEPTVYIVDDDQAFSEALSVLASSMRLKSKVFSSADQFLKQFDANAPGCLILDVRMPIMSGLALQEKLNALPLCPAIIIMTGYAEVPTALRAMRQGAVEFLQKTCDETELCEAIQRAIAQDSEKRAAFVRSENIRGKFSLLTTAEKQVLDYVLKGVANKNIAKELEVSRRTVEDRRSKIMQKLGVETIADLIRLAIKAGMNVE